MDEGGASPWEPRPLIPCAVSTADTHPNQIVYFNSFVGGLGGAQRIGLREPTDYWGNSYWQRLRWLSEHAEPGAGLLVPIARHVARSAAPVRLRPDIRFLTTWGPAPLYVMYITRSGWYDPFVRALDRDHAPIHEIRVQGGVILRIHRLAEGAEADAWHEIRLAAERATSGIQRMRAFLLRSPATTPEFLSILRRRAGREETLEDLRALVPAELHADLEAALSTLIED